MSIPRGQSPPIPIPGKTPIPSASDSFIETCLQYGIDLDNTPPRPRNNTEGYMKMIPEVISSSLHSEDGKYITAFLGSSPSLSHAFDNLCKSKKNAAKSDKACTDARTDAATSTGIECAAAASTSVECATPKARNFPTKV